MIDYLVWLLLYNSYVVLFNHLFCSCRWVCVSIVGQWCLSLFPPVWYVRDPYLVNISHHLRLVKCQHEAKRTINKKFYTGLCNV